MKAPSPIKPTVILPDAAPLIIGRRATHCLC
jgi:hypothetical protein